MADKIKENWPIITWTLGIVFVGGILYQSQGTQDVRITTVEGVAHNNTSRIHDGEVRSMKYETNQNNIMNAIQKLDMKLDSWEPVRESK